MASLEPNTSLNDDDLVRKLQEGDVAAFEPLVIKYQDRIYNLCLRMVGHAENARDLTQETFIKAFGAIHRFEHKSAFYTWLFRIAVNLAVSFRRRDRGLKMVAFDDNGDKSTLSRQDAPPGQVRRAPPAATGAQRLPPDRHLEQQEVQAVVQWALGELEEEYRAIVILRDVEGLDYQAISNILELPLGTVRSRLHRARMALKELLKPHVERVV